ncbi:MarR family transcriptional regulator [Comamonas serinivorans]|uniref:MarR family transcriptional regulator n=1 Tax=Comamonas serinivorans TaxID=1082851 RepID=A0A1Y0END4_9BURK|nr:MarR family transcriptional regulator [Comamonas serinivorans]ARU05154.1 MarR family transcriptional regulator [Comamonas serinivorans]
MPPDDPLSAAPSATAQRELLYAMGQVHKQWRRIVDRLLSPLGLSQALWLPLLHLAHAPGAMRQKDLAQSLGLDSSSVVRLVDGLAAKGWITRVDDSDRRVKKIELTPEGQAQVQALRGLIEHERALVLHGLSADEIVQTHAVVQRLLARMQALDASPDTTDTDAAGAAPPGDTTPSGPA